jgi:hypothetical protein
LTDKAGAASLQYRNIQLLLAKMIIYVNTAYRIIRLAGDGFCLGRGGGRGVIWWSD